MKKTLAILGLGSALGLGLPTLTFATDWDYSKHNSREALLTSRSTERATPSADTSSQSSRGGVLSASAGGAQEIGKMTVVYSEKGGVSHTGTVSVTR